MLYKIQLQVMKWIGLTLAMVYFICMIIFPWIDGRGDWTHVQNVWNRWQSLNVGILAFVSSIIALYASRFNAEKQRERDFLASKAFLPATLSELVSYFKASASVFKAGWKTEERHKPDFEIPVLPKEYKEVFANCIRYAKPDIGDYLSRILSQLQVHDARLRSYINQQGEDHFNPDKTNLIVYFFRLGELQALVNNLFEFARNMSEFNSTPLDWSDFLNAYRNLDIQVDKIHITTESNLEAFTKRIIARDVRKDT